MRHTECLARLTTPLTTPLTTSLTTPLQVLDDTMLPMLIVLVVLCALCALLGALYAWIYYTRINPRKRNGMANFGQVSHNWWSIHRSQQVEFRLHEGIVWIYTG